MNADWKFWFTSLAAVAGVGVPIWLWQADIDAKSLTIQLVSAAPIASDAAGAVTGVRVLVDDKEVGAPVVSVVEIRSTGRRPISASDFEAPLEIIARPPAAILKTQLKHASPVDLRPIARVDKGSLRIDPLLLNPGDRFQLTIVTSNGPPTFDSRSRIAGVSSVPIEDETEKRTTRRGWLLRVIGVALLSMYFPLILPAVDSMRRRRLRPWETLAAVTCLLGGLLLIVLPVPSTTFTVLDSLPLILVGVALGLAVAALRRQAIRAA